MATTAIVGLPCVAMCVRAPVGIRRAFSGRKRGRRRTWELGGVVGLTERSRATVSDSKSDQAGRAVGSVAVVGCGYWGKNLVRNFAQLRALRVVCDSNED